MQKICGAGSGPRLLGSRCDPGTYRDGACRIGRKGNGGNVPFFGIARCHRQMGRRVASAKRRRPSDMPSSPASRLCGCRSSNDDLYQDVRIAHFALRRSARGCGIWGGPGIPDFVHAIEIMFNVLQPDLSGK